MRRRRFTVWHGYAFAGVYDEETILKWLKTFYRRFFAQQFKRSCLPDGPKVGTRSRLTARRSAYAKRCVCTVVAGRAVCFRSVKLISVKADIHSFTWGMFI